MSSHSRRSFLAQMGRAAFGAPLLLASACSPARAPVDLEPVAPSGHVEATLLLTADTHVGHRWGERRIEELLGTQIDAMNRLPGTPYPVELGGSVAMPAAAIVAGDLTEDGRPEEWARFVQLFGRTGTDGSLHYPVYASIGNHDRHSGTYVEERLRDRHGGLSFGYDLGGLRVLTLGEGPRGEALDWLREALARTHPEQPVLIVFHRPLLGPYSASFWEDYELDRWRFLAALKDHRVLGIVHGHFHGSGMYRWWGHDVFNVGSPKHAAHAFSVLRLRDDELAVASWNWDLDAWWWSYRRDLRGPITQPGTLTVHATAAERGPAIPYPRRSS